jgi:hypothetical protein
MNSILSTGKCYPFLGLKKIKKRNTKKHLNKKTYIKIGGNK